MNVLNDEAFSDRILRIEIVADPLDSKPDSVESKLDSAMDSERNTSSKKRKIENLEEKGDAVASDSDLSCSTAVKCKTLHICSAVLATKSPFFYKLFKNGMKESRESVVSLRINASEEVALMDVLNFMYSGTLSGTTTLELLSVLVIADKFEVTSCMRYCCEKLEDRADNCQTHEIAPLCLELPSSVVNFEAFLPLLSSAKEFVIEKYKDILESYASRLEAMTLPLCALELVLGSNRLQVTSEDDLYDFILLWGRTRYPKQEERREILTNLLGRFLHFPSLTMPKLEQIRECPEFDTNEVSKLIMNSLYFNSAAYGHRYHFPGAGSCYPIHRDYQELPIKVVQLESGCIVFWNLIEGKCVRLLKSRKKVHSRPFLLGGVPFALYVVPRPYGDDLIELFVERRDAGKETFVLKYETAVMEEEEEEESMKFVSLFKSDKCTVTQNWCVGRNFVHAPLSTNYDFFEVSEHVIDGVVRIRAEFTILNSQA